MRVSAEIIDKRDLTDRECQVLALICEGAPDKIIARQLAISIKTVGAHIEHIYLKMQIRRASVNVRCAAIAHAVAHGMIRLSSTTLCVWLMAMNAGFGEQPVNAVRLRVPHVSARVRNRDV